jgi:hypothetical protein
MYPKKKLTILIHVVVPKGLGLDAGAAVSSLW